MKIAIYAATYVRDKDGVARSLYRLVSSFLEAGHEAIVWSPDVSGADGREEKIVALPSVPIPLYPDYRLGFFSASSQKELDSFSPDLLYISTPDLIGGKFLKYAQKKGLPVVSAYHTDFPSYLDYYRLGFAEGFVWSHLRRFYSACDVLFVPTREMKARLEKKGINRIDIWSRGVDRDLFNPVRRSAELRDSWGAKGKTVISYAGRFVWYKDIRVVMEVYKRFQKSDLAHDVLFVMIGSGPEEDTLRREMPSAVFPGYLVGTALPEAYASSDIFLFPSTTESFGNVVLEGLSSGLPGVVSDVGGCQELVRRSDGGYIVEAGNDEQFFACCERLIRDSELYRQKQQNGLAFAETISWPVINGKMIKRCQELVEERKGIVTSDK